MCYLGYQDSSFPSNNNEVGLFLGQLQGEDASVLQVESCPSYICQACLLLNCEFVTGIIVYAGGGYKWKEQSESRLNMLPL